MHTHLQTHKLHLYRLSEVGSFEGCSKVCKHYTRFSLHSNEPPPVAGQGRAGQGRAGQGRAGQGSTQMLMQDVAMASFHAQGRVPTFSKSACQRAKAESKELASVSKSMCMTAATQPFHVVHKRPSPINLQQTSWLRQCTLTQRLTSLIARPMTELTGWPSER